EVHRARHGLADRVEADARGVRALGAEGRVGGEDDSRIDRRGVRGVIFPTISWPAGFIGLSVRPSLFRPICRNIAPSPPSATGVTQRSSLPSNFSMRITSAPRSPSMV